MILFGRRTLLAACVALGMGGGCGAPDKPVSRTPAASSQESSRADPSPPITTVLGPVRVADIVRGEAIGGIRKGGNIGAGHDLAHANKAAGRCVEARGCSGLGADCLAGLQGAGDEVTDIALSGSGHGDRQLEEAFAWPRWPADADLAAAARWLNVSTGRIVAVSPDLGWVFSTDVSDVFVTARRVAATGRLEPHLLIWSRVPKRFDDKEIPERCEAAKVSDVEWQACEALRARAAAVAGLPYQAPPPPPWADLYQRFERLELPAQIAIWHQVVKERGSPKYPSFAVVFGRMHETTRRALEQHAAQAQARGQTALAAGMLAIVAHMERRKAGHYFADPVKPDETYFVALEAAAREWLKPIAPRWANRAVNQEGAWAPPFGRILKLSAPSLDAADAGDGPKVTLGEPVGAGVQRTVTATQQEWRESNEVLYEVPNDPQTLMLFERELAGIERDLGYMRPRVGESTPGKGGGTYYGTKLEVKNGKTQVKATRTDLGMYEAPSSGDRFSAEEVAAKEKRAQVLRESIAYKKQKDVRLATRTETKTRIVPVDRYAWTGRVSRRLVLERGDLRFERTFQQPLVTRSYDRDPGVRSGVPTDEEAVRASAVDREILGRLIKEGVSELAVADRRREAKRRGWSAAELDEELQWTGLFLNGDATLPLGMRAVFGFVDTEKDPAKANVQEYLSRAAVGIARCHVIGTVEELDAEKQRARLDIGPVVVEVGQAFQAQRGCSIKIESIEGGALWGLLSGQCDGMRAGDVVLGRLRLDAASKPGEPARRPLKERVRRR